MSWQFVVAVGLLLGFAGLVIFMLVTADGNADVWERQVYVFGAVEAIVFTAVGWIFGREVHRAGAEDARADADQAKQEAADKGAKVEELTEEVAKGRTLKAAIESIDVAAASPPARGRQSDVSAARAASQPDPAAASLATLRNLANKLYEG